MKRLIGLLLTLILLISCLAHAENAVLCDQAGRNVQIKAESARIVSCYYMSTAALLALGCADRLVGIEEKAASRNLYRLAAPQILDLPAVGSGKGVNLEAILALEPDLVVLPFKLQEDADRLASFNIPVLVVNPESEEELTEMIRLLGSAAGCEEKAQALLNRYDEMGEALASLLSGAQTPSVYLTAQSDTLTTYPAGMYQHALIERAGGRNVAGEVEGQSKIQIDPEQLLAWNPDYLFVVAGAAETAEDVLNDSQLQSLSAVQNGRVFAMPDGIEAWDYPTLSSALGQWYLASILHAQIVTPSAVAEKAAGFYRDVFGFTPDAAAIGFPDGYLP